MKGITIGAFSVVFCFVVSLGCFTVSAFASRESRIAEIGSTKGILGMLSISRSGMVAQSDRLRVLAEEVAQLNSVSSQGTQTRREVTFEENLHPAQDQLIQGGVTTKVADRPVKMERVYDPENPQADENGFVYTRPVSYAKTLTEWSMANKTFEANLNCYKTEQQMAQGVLDLGR
jgi:flagellar basal-body rod protein FlgC